jgi:hypothetical protein
MLRCSVQEFSASLPARRTRCRGGGSKPVGVNVNFFEPYVSALVTGDFAKRHNEWMKATGAGIALPDLAATNALGWPTEPATSQITTAGWQRQVTSDITTSTPLVLRFNRGTNPPIGSTATVTDVVLKGDASTGDVVLVTPSSIQGNVVTKRYRTDHEGPSSLWVKSVNSIDGANVDMDIQLWVDAAHQTAQVANSEKVFFGQYLSRLQELQPGHVRTGPNWSQNNFASGTVLPNGGGLEAWDPVWGVATDPIGSRRTLVDDPNYTRKEGVPWELSAWLANELDTDLWVCIPFIYYDQANSNDPRRSQAQTYVQNLANLLEVELDIDQQCIVEFSNEMWNTQFSTNQVLDFIDGPPNVPGVQQITWDDNSVVPAEVAPYVIDAFEWWQDAWDDPRVEFVVMGSASNYGWTEQLLNSVQAGISPEVSARLKAVGCALYFFPEKADVDLWGDASTQACMDPARVVPSYQDMHDSAKRMIDNNDIGKAGLTHVVRRHGDLALAEGLSFYAYEAGPSFLTLCGELQDDYHVFQHESSLIGDLEDRCLDRFIDGILDPGDPVLSKLVDRYVYFAFCQVQSPVGDFLLTTDLWAGTLIPLWDLLPQWKFDVVKAFNASH